MPITNEKNRKILEKIEDTVAFKKETEKLTRQLDFKNNTADMVPVRAVDEFIIHPNDLKSLKIGECYLKTTLPSGKLFIKKIQVDPTCLDNLIQHLNK